MAKNRIEITGDVDVFKKFLDPRNWNVNIDRAIKQATMKNCLYLTREVRDGIRERRYEANSPLTLALNPGKDIPLFKEGNLFNAIEFKLKTSFQAEVGVIRNSNTTGGVTGQNIQMYKLVEMMHEGYTITVTPAMRRAIMAALNEKGQLDTLSTESNASEAPTGNTTYFVPPRKFLTDIWEDPKIDKVLQQNWREGLEQFFKWQGAQDGEHRDR